MSSNTNSHFPGGMSGPDTRRSLQYVNVHHLRDDPVPPHHRWSPYEGPVIWTGPDGNTQYRLKTFPDWQLLGIGDVSPETTLSLNYLNRAPAEEPFPGPRGSHIGEVGWFYEKYRGQLRRTKMAEMER